MENEGFVSLWLGNVGTSEELERLLAISYSDEGDFAPSTFARYFDIVRYDDAVREAEYYEEPSSNLNNLLEDFSYDDVIIPEFSTLIKDEPIIEFNTVVLLYNFKYIGKNNEATINSSYFKYLGTVEYK